MYSALSCSTVEIRLDLDIIRSRYLHVVDLESRSDLRVVQYSRNFYIKHMTLATWWKSGKVTGAAVARMYLLDPVRRSSSSTTRR